MHRTCVIANNICTASSSYRCLLNNLTDINWDTYYIFPCNSVCRTFKKISYNYLNYTMKILYYSLKFTYPSNPYFFFFQFIDTVAQWSNESPFKRVSSTNWYKFAYVQRTKMKHKERNMYIYIHESEHVLWMHNMHACKCISLYNMTCVECVCVCVCMCLRARSCACVRACVRACICVCMCMYPCKMYVAFHVRMYVCTKHFA